jgi:hypothetical protein
MSLHRALNIFVPHCSELLTDHRPHGDGPIGHALISWLAALTAMRAPTGKGLRLGARRNHVPAD